MDKLREELRLTAAGNPDVSILKEAVWKLPVVTYDVSFGRVKRLKMDILMKMLLFAFQERDIHRAATLADMLFVEELFISDSIEKMVRTRLVQLDKKGYGLTAKGHDYLEKGIFEEEMEAEATQISYSAVHDEYRLAADSETPEAEEALAPYRYAVKGTVKKDRIQGLLTNRPQETDEQGFQIIITDIKGCIEHSVEHVPCIEFQLYDQKQDIFYARVWNTASASWDEKLEKGIEEREVVGWRRAMEA
ncbi:MAG TPA: hypothetical protein VLQ20_07095 [Planococcus sp. (in: firmicutes)]|nr:hypothetical protein [Planococcus sp. (in: firmicutes)]